MLADGRMRSFTFITFRTARADAPLAFLSTHTSQGACMAPLLEKRLFHSLDAARGVAAIAVVVYHSHLLFGAQWFQSGFLAVDFFFGLSGFVIAHAYGSRLTTGRMTTREFMRARFIRLYPLYLLALALIVLTLVIMWALSMNLPWSR